jgi:hypothetical protein
MVGQPQQRSAGQTWIYLASSAQGSKDDTLRIALQMHVISRPARNSKGALIPNIGRVSAGDRLVLAYRRPSLRPTALAIAIVDAVASPVEGTSVVDEIAAPAVVNELAALGFRLVARQSDGLTVAQVIHLTEVEECSVELAGEYAGQTTLRRPVGEDLQRLGMQIEAPAPTPVVAPPGDRPHAQAALGAEPLRWQQPGPPLFDAYIMVDWSASRSPSSGKDSLWLALGEWQADGRLRIASENPRTRGAAVKTIVDWCRERADKRILVGMDFAFGYPQGFARAAGLVESVPTPWRAIHEFFGAQVSDGQDNRHNGYAVATGLNERIGSRGPGPFWACPTKDASDLLTQKRIGAFSFPYSGLAEWRLTESVVRTGSPQSVWKLNCGVSVGCQTIVGIHRLQEIRRLLAGRSHLWPFETGWGAPGQSDAVVVAEIFPSAIGLLSEAGGGVKDERQVRSCVWHAAQRDVDGALRGAFEKPQVFRNVPDDAAREEEGWILFA